MQLTDLDFVKIISDQYRQDLLLVAGYICDRLYPNLQLTTLERSNFRRALAAEYIEPSAAGAPTSGGGDILPTGRNFYGIDPQLYQLRWHGKLARKWLRMLSIIYK